MMNLALPERIENQLTQTQARLDFAVGLYSSGRVTIAAAAQVAELSISAFQHELGRRRIPVNYDLEELHRDVEALGRTR